MHDRHPTVVVSLARRVSCLAARAHPLVQVFFLAILIVAQYMYLPEAWPLIGRFTKLCVVAVIVMPYLFLYLACSSDPGYITLENHAYHMSLYPYDYALFHPGHVCHTCRLLKPARSKHCSVCKRCIARADHHCVFINSCVGYGNHHWFLLLLLSTAVLTIYGGLLGLSIMSSMMKDRYPDWSLWKPSHMTVNSYLAVWAWALQRNVRLGATTLLALLTSPLVWGLLLYTLYQVYVGTTTNESLKWSVFKEDMDDGYAFRRPLPADRQRDWRTEPPCPRWPVGPAHILLATSDGNPPPGDAGLPGQGPWERIRKLKHVENLYDMGFGDNLLDSFIPSYSFGSRADDPPSERKRRLA